MSEAKFTWNVSGPCSFEGLFSLVRRLEMPSGWSIECSSDLQIAVKRPGRTTEDDWLIVSKGTEPRIQNQREVLRIRLCASVTERHQILFAGIDMRQVVEMIDDMIRLAAFEEARQKVRLIVNESPAGCSGPTWASFTRTLETWKEAFTRGLGRAS